eukprot:3665864-Pyramimonas_sp.AAC.1
MTVRPPHSDHAASAGGPCLPRRGAIRVESASNPCRARRVRVESWSNPSGSHANSTPNPRPPRVEYQ